MTGNALNLMSKNEHEFYKENLAIKFKAVPIKRFHKCKTYLYHLKMSYCSYAEVRLLLKDNDLDKIIKITARYF